jgi:excisionase family DNA binding protein
MSTKAAPHSLPTDLPALAPSVASNLNASRLLTADDLAERWSVPKAHVYRLARNGAIPCVELGRYRRFRIEAIEAFERASEVRADV